MMTPLYVEKEEQAILYKTPQAESSNLKSGFVLEFWSGAIPT
jgi:hypothetical protein